MQLYVFYKDGNKPRLCGSKIWLTMRLTAIFLTVAILQASAEGYSQQKVTLSKKDASIESVFRYIRKQTGYNFLYSDRVIHVSTPVSIDVKNVSLQEALGECMKGQPLSYHIINKTIVVEVKHRSHQIAVPEPIRVIGQVKDGSGNPLTGVSIQVKGTQNGTITDSKGNFAITVPNNQVVLIFTYIGYTTVEKIVGSNTIINVVLQTENKGLNQVVVIGYGTQKKRDLTGAVTQADMKILKESPSVNILQSLHGSVAGLSVGAVNHSGESPSLNIRGDNNFSGDNTPLIVLDGVIYRGNLNDINPNNIQSIDVLEGPSAAAIYGSQSSNGVILITTKKGDLNMKPELSYSGSISLQQPSHLVKPASPEENIQSILDSYWQNSRLPPNYIKPNPNFDPRAFLKTSHIVDGYNEFLKNGSYTNWWKLLTGNAYLMNHNLSLRGGGKSFTYFLGGGYVNQKGYIYNDNYQRYSVRMNFSGNVTKWLKLGINSFASRNNYSGASVDQSTLFTYTPFASPYDSAGNLIVEPDGNRLNPLLVSEIKDEEFLNHLFANIYLDISLPIKGLSYRINFANDYQNYTHFQFNPYGSNLRSEGYKIYSNTYDFSVDNILTYRRTFNKDNKLYATFVYGAEKEKDDSTNATAEVFTNETLGFNALQNGSAALNTIYSYAWLESSLYYMLRGVYTFKNKYILTGTIRRDGFSGFGKRNKFGIFPSVAGAWIMSDENFINNNIPWISFLKLRGSYGSTGRRSIQRYETLSKVSTNYSYVFGGTPALGQWISSLANPDLEWETTTGMDIGADFNLFNSRLTGTIDYYNSYTKDILYNVPIPQMTGFGSISINVGKIKNHGLDFSLEGDIIRSNDFTWNAGVNFSLNRSKIVSINGSKDNLVSANLFIGQPIGVIYGYVNIGMWQLADSTKIPSGFYPGTYKVKDLNGDGIISSSDRTILGYTPPSYQMGIKSTLSYKQLTLRLFINTMQGGRHYYYSTADDPGGGTGDNWTNHNKPQLWDYWLPSNPNAKYRRLDLTSTFNQPLLTQRNFVRLQNVALSYQISPIILHKLDIQNLEIYLSGQNLITLTKWKGWDPETGEGYNTSGTPVLRGYTFGINVGL